MNFAKSVWNYFVGREIDENVTSSDAFDKAAEILSKDDEISEETNVEEKIPDNACFERFGVVTQLTEFYGIIEPDLYFESPYLTKYKVGMTLTYLAYTRNGKIRISRILHEKDSDWDVSENNEIHSWCKRKIVGKVSERKGRIVIVEPNHIECDLNKIESEFIPIVGDWVQLESLVEIDERINNLSGHVLEVSKIYPLRCKLVQGVIKKFDLQSEKGQINSYVSFDKDSCVPGYVPIINDKVSAEVIESDQGGYAWRALKVIPSEESLNKHFANNSNTELFDLMENKCNISITQQIKVSLKSIGDKEIFTMDISNGDKIPHTIIGVKFDADELQLTLQSPSLSNNLLIRPKQTIVFQFLCEAKFMGMTKQLIIINFEGFNIGRQIVIHVVPEFPRNDYIKNNYKRNDISLTKVARDSFRNMTKNYVSGQRPIKPPSFIPNKLGIYEIPEQIADIFFSQMENCKHIRYADVEKISPCLKQDLNIQNYEDRFHALLYLEELGLMVNIRRYDIERACFIRNGEYLMLEVPNLSERRPSIIIGDKIFALNPIDPKAQKQEGFVHKTGSKHLYIKFHPNFHSTYKGEDYSIQFHVSRSNFRRYHQAIDLAKRNLGKNILFPTSVPSKEPQVNFVCEDDLTNGNTCDLNITNFDDTSDNIEIKSQYCRLARSAALKNRARYSKSPEKDDSASSTSSSSESSSNSNNKFKLEWFDKKLNHYQKTAVKNILHGVARPLPYFIFGPPGTGKTVTLIETILQILRLRPDSRLLVVAPSNSAADLLALRLLDSGVLLPGDLVRMVAYRCINDGTIPERLVPYSVTGDLAREGSRDSRMKVQDGVSVGMQASVLGRNRITVGTCMTVGLLYTMGFARGHFTHIIVDEAGQATEPEIMIPLSLLDVTSSQTVLAGDPLQLGPFVFSLLSKEYGLADSYFERLINRFPYVRDPIGFPDMGGYDPRLVTRLIYNYRSLPEILSLTNSLFYNDELRPVISGEYGDEVDLLKQVGEMLPSRKNSLPPAIVFHGVRGENFQSADCPSWFNPVEAGQVFYYINDLYRLGISSKDIGVITPYIKQGQQVKQLLIEAEMDLPKIGSVEEFQGQEFRVVILSSVRSNEAGVKYDAKFGLGFIASPRRLNVAISRARALLIIIGNPHLLYMDTYWRNVLSYACKIRGYRGCDLPNINVS